MRFHANLQGRTYLPEQINNPRGRVPKVGQAVRWPRETRHEIWTVKSIDTTKAEATLVQEGKSRLAPLSEPALSLIGGYSAYYLLTGFALYWVTKKLVLSRASATSWVGRHPLLALFITAWLIAVPLTALQQWQWIDAGMLVYTQFAGPVVHIGHVQLPLLILLYDPFVFATVALMCYRNDRNESVVLTKLAARLPGREGHRRATSGRQVVVAAVLMMSSILLPISAFAVVRASGIADQPTYDKYPYPEAKVYDPYGDLERAGKPGPFVR